MLALGAQLAGCASIDIRTGGTRQGIATSSTTQVQVSTDSTVGTAIIVGILFAEGVRYFLQAPDGTRSPVTPLFAAQARSVPPRTSLQDCTRPIDPAAGNLVCR